MRRCLAEEIERLIAVVDSLDVDADMEPGGEEEPYLGWIGNGPGRNDTADDREADAGDEGEMPEDDEPSLGWTVDGQHGDMRDLEGEVQLP